MVQSGGHPETPREVDHAAWFSSRAQAAQASSALAAAGYRVDPGSEPPPGEPYFLEFHRIERCDGDEPDRFTFEIMDLLQAHEGNYDGWGSLIQRS